MSEVKTNKITSLASNNDITLDPDGTGDVVVAAGHSVGIGTAAPDEYVHIKGASGAATDVQIQGGDDTNSVRLFMGGSSNRLNGRIVYDVANNAMALSTNGDERLRVDSSGNVGIGVSSPGRFVHLEDGSDTTLHLTTSSTGSTGNDGTSLFVDGTAASLWQRENDYLRFATNNTERMRIESDGSIFTQGISGSASAMSNVKIDGSNELHKDTSARITKSEIADLHIGLDEVVALTPRKFKRGSNTAFEIGFIADEMALVAPEVVMRGPKSWITNVETDTEEIDISIEYDKLTALLTKAIQELKTDLDAEKAKVADLITRVTALEAGE